MVLTRTELVASLKNEVRIAVHLAGKIDRSQLDYRPTPGQRSSIELVRYISMMGPELLQAAISAHFDVPAWNAAEQAAAARDLDSAIAAIAAQADRYAAMLSEVSDDDLRAEIAVFGDKSSRGAFIVDQLLCGCAASRMQLFLYLKACGRSELNSMNLWAGVDAPAAG